jgi:predicted DNA-binding protein
MPTRKKPSFANSNAIKSLESAKNSINLIDGEEELFGKIEIPPVNSDVVVSEKQKELTEEKKLAYKKRHNIPVYDDQYYKLQAISKITGVNITDLVREAIDNVITDSEDKIGSKKIIEMIDILQKIKKPIIK